MGKKGVLEKYESKVFEELPKKMEGVQLQEPSEEGTECMQFCKVLVPKPKIGHVLVRMEASPVTIQDIAFVRGGSAGAPKTLPAIAGTEGVGVVVASGGSILGWNLVGKRVALMIPAEQRDGAWASYCTVPVNCCVQIEDWDDIPIDISCRMFSLPMMAMNMLNQVKEGHHKACVQTDAAGPLGRMFLRLAQWEKVPVVHIVFRKDEGDVLRNLGATYVLCTTDDTFTQNLRSLSKALGATIGFDGMGGELPGQVLSAMVRDSTMCLYGSYDNRPCDNITVSELIQQNKRVVGLPSLESWARNLGLGIFGKSPLTRAKELFLCEVRDTEVSKRVELEDFFTAFDTLEEIMKADLPGMPRKSVVVTANPPREIWDKVIEKKKKEREAKEAFEKAQKVDQDRLKAAKLKESTAKAKPPPKSTENKADNIKAAAGGAAAGGGFMSMMGKLKEQQETEAETKETKTPAEDTDKPEKVVDEDGKEIALPFQGAAPPKPLAEPPVPEEESSILTSLGFGPGGFFGVPKEAAPPKPIEPKTEPEPEGTPAEEKTEAETGEQAVEEPKTEEEPGILDSLGLGGVADFFAPPTTSTEPGAAEGGGFFDFLSGPSTAATPDGADGGGGGGFFDFLTGPSTTEGPETYDYEEEEPSGPAPETLEVSSKVKISQLDVPDFHEDVRDSDEEEEEDEDEEAADGEDDDAVPVAQPAPLAPPQAAADPMALPDVGAGGLPDPMALSLPDPSSLDMALPDPSAMPPSFDMTM